MFREQVEFMYRIVPFARLAGINNANPLSLRFDAAVLRLQNTQPKNRRLKGFAYVYSCRLGCCIDIVNI